MANYPVDKTLKPVPTFCRPCAKAVDSDHWRWANDPRYIGGGKWRCHAYVRRHNKRYTAARDADPVRKAACKVYFKTYYAKNPNFLRYKGYRSADKRKYGGAATCAWQLARVLMARDCYYCKRSPSNGLDRRDSTKGHTVCNVVPCCESCNMVLGDLPFSVKLLLKNGLKAARIRGLLDTWVIPTKRSQLPRKKRMV